ncbi:MAG: type I-G CRISPR-associated protein Cas8g1/Csx17 [Streptosporangiaceae bacterium]
MTSPAITRHVLPGLRPEPLASYLAGLGLIRVLGEQADPAATAKWTPDGLVIGTTVPDIAAWLAEEYVPTPILSPWNNGSGFGARDKEPLRALEALLVHPSTRLTPMKDAIARAREVTRKARAEGWITDVGLVADKRRIVQEFRNRCPDAVVGWIDVAVVLAGEDTVFPPLLGTGGNDGRLDFSTNFHQRLLEVLGTSDQQRARSLGCARDLLADTEAEQLSNAGIGQFDPSGAGGPGSSRFGAAYSLVNPWCYVLLVEGALLFAASTIRRNQHYRPREERAAMPFTVNPSPAGSASGAVGEESRGEVWAPVWTREFTPAEIQQLFAEARASWRGRPARRAVDFYAATRTLGVARGIDEFTRYGLQRRNGLAFVAVPVDRIVVREKAEVRLAADVEDWASRFSGGDTSAAVGQAVRLFDKAHLEYARDGGALPLARMLAALTSLEQAVGRSRIREAVPVRRPPSAQEFLQVLAGHDSVPPGLRIAVGLASCATRPGADAASEPSRTMRHILLPIDPPVPAERRRIGGHWRKSPVVPGFGLRSLSDVLADVLIWRSRTAAAEHDPEQKFRGVPTFRMGIPVPASDLHALARRLVDERSLDLWLRACLALDWHGVRRTWEAGESVIPVATLGLLHPLAWGLAPDETRNPGRAMSRKAVRQGVRGVPSGDEPRFALRPEWAARLAAGQVRAVHEEAVARLRQVGWDAVSFPPEGAAATGAHIAAALVPRCRGTGSVLRKLASPIRPSDVPETSESAELADSEELL